MRVRGRGLGAAIALLLGVAVLALLLTRGGDEPAPTPRTLSKPRPLTLLGDGPLGTAPVALERWRYTQNTASTRALRRGTFTGREVSVPFSPNAANTSGPGAQRGYEGTVGWYARSIGVPVTGRYALGFASAHHRATVYVDGRRVRRHVGAYEPFTATAGLAVGRHTVSVRVDWRNPERQAAAGYGRGWFNFGGLNGPVTLARTGEAELGALNVRTGLRPGGAARVRVSVRLRNRGPARTLRPQGSLARGAGSTPLPFTKKTVARNASRTFVATLTLPDAALWSPDSPRRYALTVRVPGEAALTREVGLRELRWDDGRLRLNGKRLRLRGAGLPADAGGHGDAHTAADEQRTIGELQALGANATRSQHPLPDTMLDRLEAAGILLWQEIGPWEPAGAFRSTSVAGPSDRALRSAEREQPSASVVAWTLTNEAAGTGRPGQVEYVVRTAGELHRRDPGRPVAVDLWGRHLPRTSGPMLEAVDALGLTDYTGWYEGSELAPAAQAAEVRARLDGLRALFPDKPIVVTELGAVGTPRVAPRAFGGTRFQASLLARRVGELERRKDLSGELIWLLRDHALRPDFRGGSILDDHPGLELERGINEKGLYDITGRPKPALRSVRAAFARAAG